MEYDEIFFEEVLKNYYVDSSIRILFINREPAIAKGGNYLSDIFRVCVEFTRKSTVEDDAEYRIRERRSFILKLEPASNITVLKMVQNRMLFTVEHRILRDVLPRIESILGVQLGPKLVYGSDDLPRVIITEDLHPQGFRLVENKRLGLSMAHASMAIKNLAKFHAGSVSLAEEDPESVKIFKQAIFNGKTHPNMYLVLVDSLKFLCKAATEWSDPGSILAAEKLRKIVASVVDRVQDVYHYEVEEFCVLNHGDVWINNMLFVEDESGDPVDQLFVDYQMVNFSSPAVDLLYFLAVNPSFEIRGQGEDVLLEIYLNTLTESMVKLRCKTKPPTMKNLREAMYRRRIYAVASGLFFLPRVMTPQEEVEGIDQIVESGRSEMNAYRIPDIVRMMKKLLPLMDHRGYLDP